MLGPRTWHYLQIHTQAKDIEWSLHVSEVHFDNVCLCNAAYWALIVARPKDSFPPLNQSSLHDPGYSTVEANFELFTWFGMEKGEQELPFIEPLYPRIPDGECQSNALSIKFLYANGKFTLFGLSILLFHKQVQCRLPINQDVLICLNWFENLWSDWIRMKLGQLIHFLKLGDSCFLGRTN